MRLTIEPHCTRHASARAGWLCERCDTKQCLDCAATMNGVAVCGACGLLATVLVGPRSSLAPFRAHLEPHLAKLFSMRAGVWLLLLTSATQFMLLWRSISGWVVGQLLTVGWLAYVTRRGGRGFDPFGPPTYGDLFSIWSGPILRASPLLLPVLGTGAWWVAFGFRALPATLFPLDVALSLLAAALATVVLPTVTIEGIGRRWALPRAVKEVASIAKPALPIVAASMVLVFALELVSARVPPLHPEDTNMERPIMLLWVLHFGVITALTVAGITVGHLLVSESVSLGHESGEPIDVPWVPQLPPRAWEPPPPDLALLAEQRAERHRPIELSDPREEFAQAMQEGRTGHAMSMLQRAELTIDELTSAQLIALAQAWAARADYRTASSLLDAVLRRPADDATPRAQVILARLLDERLGQHERALALYRDVVEKFPQSAAATFATQQLNASNA